MSFTIKFKRGTASEWNNSAAPSGVVLALGEPGYEKDTGKLKIGNGITPWALLPYTGADDETIRDLVASFIQNGSGIGVVHDDTLNILTINVTGLNSSYINDFNEAVDDRVGSGLFVGGTGILLSYNDIGNSFIVSTTGVSLSGHTHDSSNITNFASSVSGLLPSITGGGQASSTFINNSYVISVTGLQPSGNYSLVGHTHTVSDISNFSSSISGLLPTIANSGDNRILTSTGTTTGINGESNLTFDGSLLSITGSGNFSGSISGSLLNIDNIRIDGNSVLATNSDGSLYIMPTGTGSLQADTRGNTRGQYSVDLQRSRFNNSSVAAGNYSVICGGANNTTLNNYNFIGGGDNNSTNNLYSIVCGGYVNNANGSYSIIGGGYLNSSSANFATTVGGFSNYNGSSYGFIGNGSSNSTDLTTSHNLIIGGANNLISTPANYSTILGGLANTISDNYSVLGGVSGVASLFGEQAYSAGTFHVAGDAETRRLILRGRDTTSSPIHLKLDGNMSGSKYLYVPSWTSWYFTIKVVARRNIGWSNSSTSNFTGETAIYKFEGAVENKSNDGVSCSILPDPTGTKTVVHEDDAGWDCNISILYNGSDPYLDIECSYDHTTEDVYWVASVDLVQVRVPIKGPTSGILTCGFGNPSANGYFTSAGFYNFREYYYNSSTGWYLYYNGTSYAINSSLGGSGSGAYTASDYIVNNWTSGGFGGYSPGGDSYDYNITSSCPTSSSSSSSGP